MTPTIFSQTTGARTVAPRSLARATWHLSSFLILLFTVATNLHAQAPDTREQFEIGTAPSWVRPVEAEWITTTARPNSVDVQELLFDKQVNLETEERYIHVTRQVVNEAGVQNSSQLSFHFDPSYQELTIHRVHIRRGTNVVDRLQREKFKVIQQERDLKRHLYDGRLSAILFLEDVRVGDVLDYSYTVGGFNPVFGNRYTDSFLVQWSVPLDRAFVRVIARGDQDLVVANHQTKVKPVVVPGERPEYLWDLKALAPVHQEDSLPIWYDPYPWVQLTEFKSWADVVNWALPLYRSGQMSPELLELVKKIETGSPTPEEKVARALQIVQDEVRYLGIEFGPNSHQPNDPNQVLARRFGDCKDKTFLLCTILSAAGIDAAPALVNTTARHTIDNWAPCPTAFNHVVTEVRLENEVYWVDPTRANQRGPLAARYLPDYGRALVIRPGVTSLSTIPRQNKALPRTTIQEIFDVKGVKDPAHLSITTISEGWEADRLRGNLAEYQREEFEKSYLNFYARTYPKIHSTKPMEVLDDTNLNVLTIIEHYRIDEFWVLTDDQKTFECEFYPRTIRSLLDSPDTHVRSMPLGVSHPQYESIRTEVRLPEPWPVQNEKEITTDTAFKLTANRTGGGTNLVMEYTYQSLTDSVPVEQVPKHLKKLQRARDALGYTLTWENEDAPITAYSPNWLLLGLGGLFMIPLGLVAGYVYRSASKNSNLAVPPVIGEPLCGLSGWLILVGFGLLATPFGLCHAMYEMRWSFSLDVWHSVTVPGSEAYHALWAPMIVFSILGNLTMLVFCVLLIFLFFQKRRLFPRAYISFLISNAVLITIDYWGAQIIPAAAAEMDANSRRDLVRAFMACIIWIPYMLVSRRVKLTFTH